MLEIVLAIFACLRGWKAWAFLPIAIVIGLGFLLVFVSRAIGLSMECTLGIGLLLDLICIVVLIVMIAKPREDY